MGPKVLHVERDRTLNLMATSYSIFWKYIWYWTKISSSWTLGSVSYLDENLKPPDASSVPLLFPTKLATRVSLIKLILTKFQKKIIAQKYFISLLVFSHQIAILISLVEIVSEKTWNITDIAPISHNGNSPPSDCTNVVKSRCWSGCGHYPTLHPNFETWMMKSLWLSYQRAHRAFFSASSHK